MSPGATREHGHLAVSPWQATSLSPSVLQAQSRGWGRHLRGGHRPRGSQGDARVPAPSSHHGPALACRVLGLPRLRRCSGLCCRSPVHVPAGRHLAKCLSLLQRSVLPSPVGLVSVARASNWVGVSRDGTVPVWEALVGAPAWTDPPEPPESMALSRPGFLQTRSFPFGRRPVCPCEPRRGCLL